MSDLYMSHFLLNQKCSHRKYHKHLVIKTGASLNSVGSLEAHTTSKGTKEAFIKGTGLDLCLRVIRLSSSESNTDSVITSLPSANSRMHKINALDANAQWELTLKLITLSWERCDVGPHCNVM